MDFEKVMAALPRGQKKRLAVAAAADAHVLEAASEARRRNLAEPLLCGEERAVRRAAEAASVDIGGMEIHPAETDAGAAALAVRLVREGRADMLMKGLLQTATLLRAVLDKESGLRGEGVLSHVSVLHSPVLRRMLLLTDAAMVTYPDLETKARLVQNAVAAARGLGIEMPKVAVLAAVEVVNEKMQATLDAAALTAMNRRGQLPGCLVDGPLAMDLALSREAAEMKGVTSEVAGQADILLLHNIDAANPVLKTFTVAGGCLFGGVVMGAQAPIVLASRSETVKSKLYSIACAAAICDYEQGRGAR